MSITVNSDKNSKTFTIAAEGRFDFKGYTDFVQAFKRHNADDFEHFVIALDRVTNIDSTALGALLVFREWARSESHREPEITVRYQNDPVHHILTTANLNKLFILHRL